MRIVRTIDELRAALPPGRVGLVATMGAFHDGHLSLFRAARAECDFVVVSLFVNPAQFGPAEDLERYPRDEERDARLAEEIGVDHLFVPTVAELYPPGFSDSSRSSSPTKRGRFTTPAQRSPRTTSSRCTTWHPSFSRPQARLRRRWSR